MIAGAPDPAAGGTTEQAGEAPDTGGPGAPAGTGSAPAGTGSAPAGTGSVRPAPADPGPSVAALVNITVPLAAMEGDPGAAGDAAGFGLLDARDALALVSAAARHPRTRWCLTVLHPDGTAAAHGCADGRHSWPAGPLTGQQAADFLAALRLTLNSVIRGPCDHAQAQAGYRPGRKLQHLVNARNTRCTAPGCSRPAARCDLDHTDPWHHSKLTCPCNLSPRCKR